MEILNEIKFYKQTGKLYNNTIREALLQHGLFECFMTENEITNRPERIDVLNKINNDQYIRNDYESFLQEIGKNKRSSFLTPYTVDEFKNAGVQTFQVPGYEIGFALKPMPEGDNDIISVHNNTNIHGIGDALIDSAKRLGGTTLDHFDGFLSDFYNKKGFKEYDRWKWDDQYAPTDWDYEKYGKPDVILRRLQK